MKQKLKLFGKFIVTHLLGFILGFLVFGVAQADEVTFILNAQDVSYDNTKSGSSATNVKAALDDLNAKADDLLNPSETYTAYAAGDSVTIGGVGYHVISASGTDQDYVTVVKDAALTSSEMDELANEELRDLLEEGTNFQVSGEDIVFAFGDSTNYEDSLMKEIIDVWADNNFNEELKTVDGYKARLIKYEELEPFIDSQTSEILSTYDWLYGEYFTMSKYGDDGEFYYVMDKLLDHASSDATFGEIKPVLNVYKSALNS